MRRGLIYIVILLMAGCAAPKLPGLERIITFGYGGGFTGKVTQYSLSSLGYIYIQGQPGVVLKPKVTKKKLDQIFTTAANIKKDCLGFSQPGNLYYFIYLGDTRNQPDYVWGNDQKKPPEAITQLYDLLMATVPREK